VAFVLSIGNAITLPVSRSRIPNTGALPTAPRPASKTPLRKWLYAMYLVVTSRKDLSSLQLSKELGITQKSAWFLHCRLDKSLREVTTKYIA
jgi:hypothetical protein